MTECTYEFAAEEVAGGERLDGWACPHAAHPDADRCVLHLDADEREALGVDDETVVDRVRDLVTAEDRRHKRAVGARLPELDLEYRTLSGPNRYPVDLRYARVEGLALASAVVEQPLDLRGATVERLDLAAAEFDEELRLAGADLGAVAAAEATFADDLDCTDARLGRATFEEVRFEDDVGFADATFAGVATFSGVDCRGRSTADDEDTSFAGATFEDEAVFEDSRFHDAAFREAVFQSRAGFEDARFVADVSFDDAVFEGVADFDEVHFGEDASLVGVEYHDEAHFRGVECAGGANLLEDDADFENSRFRDLADFREAEFVYVDFTDTRFDGEADFEAARFEDDADFHRAEFAEAVTFQECRFRTDAAFDDVLFGGAANFDEAHFGEDVSLKRAVFGGEAHFRGVRCVGGATVLEDNTDFEEVHFQDLADFRAAEFVYVDFTDTRFDGEADFSATVFDGDADFHRATFAGRGVFEECRFAADAAFDDAVFEGVADFDEARFEEDASLVGVEYHDEAHFRGVECAGGANVLEDDADFEDSRFHGPAAFDHAEFPYVDFTDVTFEDRADFSAAAFDEDADFARSTVAGVADFDETRFAGDADFSAVTFEDDADFRGAVFAGEARQLEENARFVDATFRGAARFDGAAFTSGDFTGVGFGGLATFSEAEFRDRVEFVAESLGETTYVDMSDAHLAEGRIVQPEDDWLRYDLSGVTVGEVSLESQSESHRIFEYVRLLEATFEGFDFAAHRHALDRNDYRIHDFDAGDGDYEVSVDETAEAVETTYLNAYNCAKSMGHGQAAMEFAIHRAIYRRKKNVGHVGDAALPTGTRLRKAGEVVGNHLWYQSCGYGYRLWRILGVSTFAILLYGLVYTLPIPGTSRTARSTTETAPELAAYGDLLTAGGLDILRENVYYSLITFTTVGYGDINPQEPTAQLLAASEGVLGVLLAALVVFVLGRRVAL